MCVHAPSSCTTTSSPPRPRTPLVPAGRPAAPGGSSLPAPRSRASCRAGARRSGPPWRRRGPTHQPHRVTVHARPTGSQDASSPVVGTADLRTTSPLGRPSLKRRLHRPRARARGARGRAHRRGRRPGAPGLRRRRVRRRQEPPRRRASATARAERGRQAALGRLRRARHGRAALRADRRRAAPARAPRRPRLRRARPGPRASSPACCPSSASPASCNIEPIAGSGQGRLFELLLDLVHRLSRDAAARARPRRPPLGRRARRATSSPSSRATCAASACCSSATYRSDELHRRHPLRPLLAELERIERTPPHRARALHPRGARRDARRRSSARAPDAGLLERLYERTEGNALFTEELLAAGGDGPAARVAARRADRCASRRSRDDAQELLRWVAAAQRADQELLAEVTGLEARALREALREAVAHNVLIGEDDGTFAFRHALLREVVHDDLLPGEHGEMHRALARALERRLDEVCHEVDLAARDRPPLRRRRRPARGAGRRRRAPRRRPSGSTRTSRPPRCSTARSSCGTASTTPSCSSGSTTSSSCARPRGSPTATRHGPSELLHARAGRGRPRGRAGPRRAPARGPRPRALELGHGRGRGRRLRRGALRCCPRTSRRRRGRPCWPRRPARFMLWGRYVEGAELAREAIEAAETAGSESARGHALNTLGVCRAYLGEAAERRGGRSRRRSRSRSPARTSATSCAATSTSPTRCTTAGRTREARRDRSGRARRRPGGRPSRHLAAARAGRDRLPPR